MAVNKERTLICLTDIDFDFISSFCNYVCNLNIFNTSWGNYADFTD